MSSVEPWRLKDLALILNELTLTLESGKNPEWASVFAHFGYELKLLGSNGPDSRAGLKKLLRSLRLCLDAGGGFSRLVLEVPGSDEEAALNLRFGRLRAALTNSVEGIGKRLAEYVN